ncbi:MAG: nucleotide exchange factor GrpE [Candidatus Kerfeldbacteria bacterium]|nr:nucleotide exchange factor GrpE [Candidatus Kerfeldbacteria bacterium]
MSNKPPKDAKQEKETPAKETDLEKCARELEAARTEAQTNLDGWKRAKADYQNLLKDSARERLETVKFATENLLHELLPLVDYFKYGLKAVPEAEKNSAWMQGMTHIYNQFMSVLKDHGVEELKTVGEKFDPAMHQSVEEVKSDTKPGTIVEEVASGFRLNGKVIQVAKVKISK